MPTAKLDRLEAAWSASPQDSRPTTARRAGPVRLVFFFPSTVIGVRP